MTSSKTNEKPTALWRFFSSVRLTIVLLIIVALASIAGTLVPQGPEAMDFARRLSPPLLRLFHFVDLFDVYHSIWFRALLGFLALNLIVCSLDRLPTTWRRFRAAPKPDRQKPFEKVPPEQIISTSLEYPDAVLRVRNLMEKRYKRVRSKEADSTLSLYGEKGRYSHFGVYLVHLSVLIILAGALVGSFLGFEAVVNVPEGERVKRVWLRTNMTPLELDFEIQCDAFHVEFYPNGTPKEYRSELTFLVQDEAVHKASVTVNHPAQFRGVNVYQSSYGTIPAKEVRLRVSRETSEISSDVTVAEMGETVSLPGGEGHFQVLRIQGDFMRMGPAVEILVHPPEGEQVRFWIFQQHEQIQKRFPGIMEQFPRLNPAAYKPYTFSVEELQLRYYTGLQVNKDPGVPVVWGGCFLMVAGFFVTFFSSHRKIWLRVSDQDGRAQILVAGSSTKNPVGLQRELDSMAVDLKQVLEDKVKHP